MVQRPDCALPFFRLCQDAELPAGLKYISSRGLTDLGPGIWVAVRAISTAATMPVSIVSTDIALAQLPAIQPGGARPVAALHKALPAVACSLMENRRLFVSRDCAACGIAFRPGYCRTGQRHCTFPKLADHQERIRRVAADRLIWPSALRDQQVACDSWAVLRRRSPASGGTECRHWRLASAPSVATTDDSVKGYHGWSGRALLALSAVALAHKCLGGYRIEVPLASSAVQSWIEKMRAELGLDIHVAPYVADHEHAIDRLARARAVVGVGISDGISTTLLESMAVGTFPIQSSTACADEWIECGRSGFVVSPWDTGAIADAIFRAVTDDDLVDRAAAINLRTVTSRWSAAVNGAKVWEIYDRITAGGNVIQASQGP